MRLFSWPRCVNTNGIVPVLCGLTAFLASLPSSFGVVLYAGYKVEGGFSGFTPTGNQLTTKEILPGIFVTQSPEMSIGVHFNDMFTAADTVQLEIFANDLQQAPLFSGEFTGPNNTDSPGSTYGFLWLGGVPSEIWPDLNGAYRFTMLSGSADLDAVNIRTYNNLNEYVLNFNSFPIPISVPEPACIALLAIGTVGLLLRRK